MVCNAFKRYNRPNQSTENHQNPTHFLVSVLVFKQKRKDNTNMKLTELKCKNVTHDPNKVIKLSDGQGLSLWLMKSGTKCWRYSYRYNKKQKTLALGIYPDIGLKEARMKKIEARALLDEGKDPHP